MATVGSPIKAETSGITDETTLSVVNYRRKHYCGIFTLNVHLLQRPKNSFVARNRVEEHVQKLMVSFRQTGTLNESIEVAIVNDTAFDQLETMKEEIVREFGEINPDHPIMDVAPYLAGPARTLSCLETTPSRP